MKKTLAAIIPAVMLSLGGLLASAAPAHADPTNCSIGAWGNNGNSSFTVHWDTNYCRYPVRAWVDCTAEELGLGLANWTATGSSSTSISDSSDAKCGFGITESYYYGYDIYINGSWHRFNMYSDIWQS